MELITNVIAISAASTAKTIKIQLHPILCLLEAKVKGLNMNYLTNVISLILFIQFVGSEKI